MLKAKLPIYIPFQTFERTFFCLLPLASNLKIVPVTIFDLLLGARQACEARKNHSDKLLALCMAWIGITYGRGIWEHPLASTEFWSCLRYLCVAVLVLLLNQNLIFSREKALQYLYGVLGLAALIFLTTWCGFYWNWGTIWIQHWLLTGPSFMTFTLILGFTAAQVYHRKNPRSYLVMLTIILFYPPILESRNLDYFSWFAIGFSVFPLRWFLQKKQIVLLLLTVGIIVTSQFAGTIVLKKIGVFPFSIEKIQINPAAKLKERIYHDMLAREFDTDRKGQISRTWKGKDFWFFVGKGGMSHQKMNAVGSLSSVDKPFRPMGLLVQRYDGGIVLVALTLLLLGKAFCQSSLVVLQERNWNHAIVPVAIGFGALQLYITNPTGSLQWWLFLVPGGLLVNLLSESQYLRRENHPLR
jgi:hypothetical protein